MAVQAGLYQTWSGTKIVGFLMRNVNYFCVISVVLKHAQVVAFCDLLVYPPFYLDQAGIVPEDVVTTGCTVSAPFLLACQSTPAKPACIAAGTACAVYSAGKWAWDKVKELGHIFPPGVGR